MTEYHGRVHIMMMRTRSQSTTEFWVLGGFKTLKKRLSFYVKNMT